MRSPPFLLFGCPVLILVIAVAYLLTFRELHRTPFHAALIAASTVAVPSGHMREILAQLNLTDSQRRQIEQIRQTVSDRDQRRQAIFNVLTADQRVKFQQLRDQQ
jgi:Spy/CpxP family protein refolding chaperone